VYRHFETSLQNGDAIPMAHRILGLHHVTATVDEAQPDIDFSVGALGLRLVKKTVNFDNRHVYHFYYGDERGTPGTIWTTFPYHGHGVRVGTKGFGQIVVTSFSVPPGSLEYWRDRLRSRGLTIDELDVRFGARTLMVTDPSGLAIELVEADDAREGWSGGGVAPEHAIRGLHSVTMQIRAPAATVALLTEVLGFVPVIETDGIMRLAVNGDTPGRRVEIVHGGDAPSAANGRGTVHHVALAIATAEEQRSLRDDLIRRGYSVTEVLDRFYFQSIYFREPGGVLLEVATVGPGFDVDEAAESLGRDLKLPPWQEPNRTEIEAGLAPVAYPGSSQ
jgi:glyoxalase family protein